MADEANEQRGGERTIEDRGRDRGAFLGYRTTGPAARRPQQRGQEHEECRMRLQAVGGIAEVLGYREPPVGGDSADVTKVLVPRADPPLNVPDRWTLLRQEPFHRLSLRLGYLRQYGLTAGHLPGDAALQFEGDRALGPQGRLCCLDRVEDPGDLPEHRLRRLCRTRGVLGLGPRLVLVRQACQGLLEVGRPSCEPIEPGGCQDLPPFPDLLHRLERGERRMLRQEAERPLEFQADEGAGLGQVLLDQRDCRREGVRSLIGAQERLGLRGPRRYLRERDRAGRWRGRRFLRD